MVFSCEQCWSLYVCVRQAFITFSLLFPDIFVLIIGHNSCVWMPQYFNTVSHWNSQLVTFLLVFILCWLLFLHFTVKLTHTKYTKAFKVKEESSECLSILLFIIMKLTCLHSSIIFESQFSLTLHQVSHIKSYLYFERLFIRKVWILLDLRLRTVRWALWNLFILLQKAGKAILI
jgi:hypothetical protein